MVSIFKTKLDQLMGQNRNIQPGNQPKSESYTNRDVS